MCGQSSVEFQQTVRYHGSLLILPSYIHRLQQQYDTTLSGNEYQGSDINTETSGARLIVQALFINSTHLMKKVIQDKWFWCTSSCAMHLVFYISRSLRSQDWHISKAKNQYGQWLCQISADRKNGEKSRTQHIGYHKHDIHTTAVCIHQLRCVGRDKNRTTQRKKETEYKRTYVQKLQPTTLVTVFWQDGNGGNGETGRW